MQLTTCAIERFRFLGECATYSRAHSKVGPTEESRAMGISRVVALSVCVIFSPTVFAYDATKSTPAIIGNGERSLRSLIEFPDIEEDVINLVLPCASYISKKGRYMKLNCYASSKNRKFFRSVYTAAQHARAEPAMLDGKNVVVWLQFSVLFKKNNKNSSIIIYSNFGEYKDVDPERYISPQPILKRNHLIRRAWSSCRDEFLYFVDKKISIDGELKNFEIIKKVVRGSVSCPRAISTIAKNRPYIPGYLDGEPSATQYIEPYYCVH